MANNDDKDILITPNVGQSGYPNISFKGYNADTDGDSITMNVLDDNTLSFESDEGQVFSIGPVLSSGTIFSVNDISGVPSITVDANGTITLAPYQDGNIGIGMTSPTAALHITSPDTATEAFRVDVTDTDSTADSTPFVVDGNGRVGIGTASPLTDMALTLNGDGTTYEGLAFQSGGSTKWKLSTDGSAWYHDSQVNTLDYNIRLRDSNGAYQIFHMNADTAGTLKVGIGTTSPDATLDIKTGGSGSRTAFNAVADDLVVDSTGDTGISISSSNTATGNIFFADSDSDARGQIRYDHAGNTMRLATSGTERFRIGQSGELGIGGATYGTSGQVLTSGGSGAAVSWGDVSASPAGSDSQIQYNNGGSLGGDADFTWDDANNRLVIGSVASQHDALGKLTVKGTDASFLLEKHDDSASGGPTMTLYRYSASVADGDLIGQVNFRGEGSTGNPSTYISMRAEIEDTTEGTKDAALIVRGLINNTQTNLAEIHGAGLTLSQGTFNGNMGTTTYKPVVYMDTGTQNVNQTEATIGFNSEVLDPAGNASSTTDGHIRLAAGGYYRVSYSIPINDDGSTLADRTRVFCFAQVDDNDSFTSPTTVAQSRCQVYTRESSGGSGLSTSFIYEHTANDYIRLRIDAENNTDISTETNQCQISIEYLGPA
jgi:hypothetical protein